MVGFVKSLPRIRPLTLAAWALPVWLVAGALLWKTLAAEAARDRWMADEALALVRASDRQVADVVSALDGLAASPELAAGDLTAFRAKANDLVNRLGATTLLLTASDGRTLVNTLFEDVPQRRRTSLEVMAKVFATGRPAVSDLFIGPVSKLPMVAIELPIPPGRYVVQTLAVNLPVKPFQELVANRPLPAGVIDVLLDGNRVVIARSVNSERLVGAKVAPTVVEAFQRKPDGIVEAPSFEGVMTRWAACRSQENSWMVVVGRPAPSPYVAALYWGLWSVSSLVLLAAALRAWRRRGSRLR